MCTNLITAGTLDLIPFVYTKIFHNPIRITPPYFPLTYLDISKNNLSELSEDFFEKTSIESLICESNGIEGFPETVFDHLPMLKALCLDNNQIKELQPSVFMELRLLETLLLANNQLYNLPEDIFLNLSNLNRLSLKDNLNLADLPDEIFYPTPNLSLLTLPTPKFEIPIELEPSVPTIKSSEKPVVEGYSRRECPICGNNRHMFIYEEIDKKNIVMDYPRIYGKKFKCGKCGGFWKISPTLE